MGPKLWKQIHKWVQTILIYFPHFQQKNARFGTMEGINNYCWSVITTTDHPCTFVPLSFPILGLFSLWIAGKKVLLQRCSSVIRHLCIQTGWQKINNLNIHSYNNYVTTVTPTFEQLQALWDTLFWGTICNFFPQHCHFHLAWWCSACSCCKEEEGKAAGFFKLYWAGTVWRTRRWRKLVMYDFCSGVEKWWRKRPEARKQRLRNNQHPGWRIEAKKWWRELLFGKLGRKRFPFPVSVIFQGLWRLKHSAEGRKAINQETKGAKWLAKCVTGILAGLVLTDSSPSPIGPLCREWFAMVAAKWFVPVTLAMEDLWSTHQAKVGQNQWDTGDLALFSGVTPRGVLFKEWPRPI